jgi:Tol biopolymer transport system component/predicted Ser/Thr protein kinase
MPLVSGTRLGPYEVQSSLGEGGMGIVYRAHDTKLKRDVALKVLPDHLADDEDRLSRFQREAQVLAAVNHSNIAQIYGLEESGKTRCIVMELVDGDTLQEVVKRGPLPVEETLAIAKQLAEGLEAAHERGIVHRDLKPANIKRTQNGTVKILDFGLARVFEAGSADASLTNSPTMMSGTAAGMIIGTAAYMSPEQARGKAADNRADIWAFGAVVFELLTGRQAFAGDTVTDVLASVMKNEPDWSALPSSTPEQLQSLLWRCLKKDSKRRLQHIGDARIAIEDIFAGDARLSPPTTPVRPTKERYVWVLVTLVLLAAIVFLGMNYFRRRPADVGAPAVRLTIPPPEKTIFRTDGAFHAISPDGTNVAFLATDSNYQPQRLWVRPLDSLTTQVLAGTDGALAPFWSADGKSLAFFQGGRLKKVDLSGSSVQTMFDIPLFWRGTWNSDGVIIFGMPSGPLRRATASGGALSDATELDKARGETSHRSPVFLPDGRHFLYSLDFPDTPPTNIVLGVLDSKDSQILFKDRVDWLGGYVAPGYLVYRRDRSLIALPFDVQSLKVTGEPIPIVNDVEAAFSASANGLLAYRARAVNAGVKLVWFDRSGSQVGVEPISGALQAPNLSRDGKRVTFEQSSGGTSDIRILDLLRGTNMRVTLEGNSGRPVFSPDGTRVAFARYSKDNSSSDVLVKSASGTGPEQRLAEDAEPTDWSPDGRHIIILKDGGLFLVNLNGDGKATPLVTNPGGRRARFSPDGKWISYESNESGRYEIYVQRFPPQGDRVQVSVNGGDSAWWRSDGKELFFNAPDRKLMAVDVTLGSNFGAAVPHALFEVPGFINNGRFVASLDGNRFLMPIQFQDEFQPLTVIVNWPAMLRNLPAR